MFLYVPAIYVALRHSERLLSFAWVSAFLMLTRNACKEAVRVTPVSKEALAQ